MGVKGWRARVREYRAVKSTERFQNMKAQLIHSGLARKMLTCCYCCPPLLPPHIIDVDQFWWLSNQIPSIDTYLVLYQSGGVITPRRWFYPRRHLGKANLGACKSSVVQIALEATSDLTYLI